MACSVTYQAHGLRCGLCNIGAQEILGHFVFPSSPAREFVWWPAVLKLRPEW